MPFLKHPNDPPQAKGWRLFVGRSVIFSIILLFSWMVSEGFEILGNQLTKIHEQAQRK